MADAGDFHILSELKPGQSWLARDPLGYQRVLKRLPEDCLMRGQLHPTVKLRLQRLREIPVSAMASLVGVERLPLGVVMVWEHIEGTPLAEALGDESRRAAALRELRIAIGMMHQMGLVHGAIHPSNVVVDASGKVRLLDASPHLHDDPAIDYAAYAKIAGEGVTASPDVAELHALDRRDRQRSTLVAVALAVLGISLAVGAAIYLAGR